MFSEDTRQEITRIWNTYIEANKQVLDTKGRVINDIDVQRATAIEEIKEMMNALFSSKVNISEFKTSLDGYNKRNNLWGFTAAKGQMFFNQLVKANEQNLPKLLALFRNTLVEPRNLKEAIEKLDEFEKFVRTTFAIAVDKRKAPNPVPLAIFSLIFGRYKIRKNGQLSILHLRMPFLIWVYGKITTRNPALMKTFTILTRK